MSKNGAADGGPAVRTRGLVKLYGTHRALDGVDLTIGRGQVFGFLGPNGAGKTTTIRVLATLTRPDGGTARVLGHDVATEADAIRAKVSVTGQFASLDEDLTGFENLAILGRLHGLSRTTTRQRADALLSAFDLTGAAGRPVRGYSGGMRRRLDIGASLVVTPELLFLDEPTTGLDPHSRTQVWELVRRVAAAGTTVLLTTQYLEEADQLAERIAVIDHGRVVAEGTSAQLKARVGSGTLRLRLADGLQRARAREVLVGALRGRGAVQLDADPLGLSVALAGSEGAADGATDGVIGAGTIGEGANGSGTSGDGTEVGRLVGHALIRLADAGVAVADVSLGQPSLDEAFLALTGHPTTSAADEPADEPQDVVT